MTLGEEAGRTENIFQSIRQSLSAFIEKQCLISEIRLVL